MFPLRKYNNLTKLKQNYKEFFKFFVKLSTWHFKYILLTRVIYKRGNRQQRNKYYGKALQGMLCNAFSVMILLQDLTFRCNSKTALLYHW